MMLSGKRILLTGGAGFIGTALARRLVDDNQVVIYDNGHRNALSDTDLLTHPNLHLIWGDVLDFEGVRNAIRGCQLVVHLAAIAGVDTVLAMPVMTMKVNIIGTYHVLEAALQETGIERFIDFSTSEVFGTYAYRVQEGDVTSLGAVGEARWTYAVSKLATEHMAHNYYKQYGLPVSSIRPFNIYGPGQVGEGEVQRVEIWRAAHAFNIYGPGQVGEGAIHRFIVRALQAQDLEVHNDGSQIRAWCYIDDIVDGILLCLERPEAIGQVFNIGNPRSVCTVYDLARRIVRLSDSRSRIVFVRWDYTDVELRVPNIDKARRLLGYEPKVDLDEGLLRTIAWYRGRMSA